VPSSSHGGGLSALDAVAAQAQAMLAEAGPATDIKFCGVDDPTCEACQ
jgi:ribonucleoside-diphosphate reductase alpha chain